MPMLPVMAALNAALSADLTTTVMVDVPAAMLQVLPVRATRAPPRRTIVLQSVKLARGALRVAVMVVVSAAVAARVADMM